MPSYQFTNIETGQKVSIFMEFSILFENQSLGIFHWKNEALMRDVSAELKISPLKTNIQSNKVAKTGQLKRSSLDAAAFHPSQVGEAREHFGNVHSGISVSDNGSVHFSSRGARKQFLRDQKMYDRDGGYGD